MKYDYKHFHIFLQLVLICFEYPSPFLNDRVEHMITYIAQIFPFLVS